MASERMVEAIGRLERAIARVEAEAKRQVQVRAALGEALTRSRAEAANAKEILAKVQTSTPDGLATAETDPFSRDKAIAALKSLDSLIGDLQKARADG
jgi:molybdopterin biosynthesis enzyme